MKKKDTADRALLLMTQDILNFYNENTYEIRPGDLGENVLLKGVNYDSLVAGTKIKIGNVTCELTEQATTCRKVLTLPFAVNRKAPFTKISKNKRGWYAKVLEEGDINVGDSATIVK